MKLVLEARSRTLVLVSGEYASPLMAEAIRKGQPSQKLIVLLAEAAAGPADFSGAEVVVVPGSALPVEQVALVKATFERATEAVLLVDSLSRLARIFNRVLEDPTGWVVSGIEPKRVEPLKQLILSGGTMVGIVEVDPDSRTSQTIYELFKPLVSSELTWSA